MRHAISTSAPDALSWTLIAALLGGCAVLGSALGFSVHAGRAVLPVIGIALLGAGLVTARRSRQERVAAGAAALLQMTLFTVAGVVFAYLLAARDQPLWDSALRAADAWLGIHWSSVLAEADRLPEPLLLLAGIAYHSLSVQMVAAILVLAWCGQLGRLRLMVAAAILAGTVTVLMSAVMPATGLLFDPADYQRLPSSVAWLDRDLMAGLRGGTMTQVDLSDMTGIVTFPSYHATLPVILLWGVRPVRRLFPAAALWVALTVAATPLFGGHYAVDLIGGLLLAPMAIVAVTPLAARSLGGPAPRSGTVRGSVAARS